MRSATMNPWNSAQRANPHAMLGYAQKNNSYISVKCEYVGMAGKNNKLNTEQTVKYHLS